MTDIRHDPEHHRFATTVEGHEAYLDYQREGGKLVVVHTLVPEEIGGRGIAGELVKTALDYARGEGLKVVPRCSYTQAYLARHREYADLVA